jgi:hypothetical protein
LRGDRSSHKIISPTIHPAVQEMVVVRGARRC